MLDLGGETVTIKRPASTTNRYGSSQTNWASTTDTTVSGCLFAPQSTSEDNDGRTATIVGARLFMPAGTDVESSDRIVIRTETYEVDGDPHVWTDPTGSGVSGVEVPLRKVEG